MRNMEQLERKSKSILDYHAKKDKEIREQRRAESQILQMQVKDRLQKEEARRK